MSNQKLGKNRSNRLITLWVLLMVIVAGCSSSDAPAGLSSAAAPLAPAEAHIALNPFEGAQMYVNQEWSGLVLAEADAVEASPDPRFPDPDLSGKMRTVASYPTAVWLSSKAAINELLEDHLKAALAQQADPSKPVIATFVIYDLPGRDCSAQASTGEIPGTIAGLEDYKTNYIDRIADILAKPDYASLRIATIIEPDGMGNAISNLIDMDAKPLKRPRDASQVPAYPGCAADVPDNGSGPYIYRADLYHPAVVYAVQKLHAVANVYTYLDTAHGGWLGWPSNVTAAAKEYKAIALEAGGMDAIDGFTSNTSNYVPFIEPPEAASSPYFGGNSSYDESKFLSKLYTTLTTGTDPFPTTIGMITDTGRNGWGGPNKNTCQDPSDPETCRLDRRPNRGVWCNILQAGIGTKPSADAADISNPPDAHLDAKLWIKPPGESDGNPPDPFCIYNNTVVTYPPNNETSNSDTWDNSPKAGGWFSDQFRELVYNADPVPGVSPKPSVCEATYSIVGNPWPDAGGTAYKAVVVVKNKSTKQITSWKVEMTYPNAQTITQGPWNAKASSKSGAVLALSNESYNGDIPAGQSTAGEIGFIGRGSNNPPLIPTLKCTAVTSGGPNPSGCTATYQKTAEWSDGYTAQFTITNTGSTATKSWKIGYALSGGGRLNNESWGLKNVGATSAESVDYDSVIQPGQSIGLPTPNMQIGFNVRGATGNPKGLENLTCTATF